MHRQDDYIEAVMSDVNLIGSLYGQITDDLITSHDDDAIKRRVTMALAKVAEESHIKRSNTQY